MKTFMPLAICLVLSIGASWADIIGSTDPAQFPDSVDWCQLGCAGAVLPTPTSWVSTGGASGTVGLAIAQPLYNLQEDTSWFGNFNPLDGLIYNGSDFGNTPTDIVVDFNSAQSGVGAYIQAESYGPFTATITLLDKSLSPLGSFSASGTSNVTPGTAFFLGAVDTTAPVWGVQFDAIGTGPAEPDFAIGTMRLNTPTTSVPEPATGLLFLCVSIALASRALLRRTLRR